MGAVLGLVAPPPATAPPPAGAPLPAAPAGRARPRRAGGRSGPLTGAVWAGYEVGDLLGSGGMGEVYLAREAALDRLVALKVMALAVAADSSLRRRWGNEARALASVDSPHVVRVLATGEEAERPYLAMELLEGGSLAEDLAARRLSGERHAPLAALELVLAAARGLAAAHAAGLVHRDIKPGNLMRDAAGTLKLVDFGLVRFAGEAALTLAGSALGTPQYMAPEQGRGEPADARSDLYGLGCVLYELLTGEPPFSGESPEALVFQHGFAEPALPSARVPSLPPGLEAVCLACLQKDPARRYQDAAALIADLERLRAGLAPLSALFAPGRLGTGADEALRRLGLRRRWWPLAAAAGLALALAGGWWWWDARKAEEQAVRGRLAPLARPAAPPDTAAADLARLAALAGSGDPQVRQGSERLAALARLRDGLAALAGQEHLPEARARAAALVESLAQATGGGDPALAPWRARLDAVAAEAAALRQSLAELDRAAPATAALRALARPRLDRLALLAGEDDGEVRRWRALCAAAAAEQERLAGRLARLDDPAPLTAAAVAELAAAHLRLAALDPGAGLPAAWAARLEGDRRRLAALGERLAAALDRPAEDDHAAAAAEEAARELAALQALPAADERRLEERRQARAAAAAARAQERERLARRCAVLDRPQPPPADITAALAAYEALAGPTDEDLQRWRDRLERVRAINLRLGQIAGRSGPLPAGSVEQLAELERLCGDAAPLAVVVRTRLAAEETQRAAVAQALARPGAPVPDLAPAVASLGADHPGVRELESRRLAWQAAERLLGGLDACWVLPPAELAATEAALEAVTAFAGADHPATAAWARRLAQLRGPAAPAWAAAAGRDRHGPWLRLEVDGAAQRLRWRPPGSFRMGSPADEEGRDDDEVPVAVRLTRGQWVGDSECTQALWRAVMGGNPSRFPGDVRPVEQVDQAQAEAFCRRLSARLAGWTARLPSEAEWEAAVRGGQAGPFPGLDAGQAAAAVVHHGTGLLGAAAAGGRAPGPLGLLDAAGNLWEWCAGGYGPQPVGDPAVDPAPPAARLAPIRGGSWADPLRACRAANRRGVDPATSSPQLGFRLVIDPPEAAP